MRSLLPHIISGQVTKEIHFDIRDILRHGAQ